MNPIKSNPVTRISSQLVDPHYLAYFNELVGDPENGYNVLVDINLDLGQVLKGLNSGWIKTGLISSVFPTSAQQIPDVVAHLLQIYRAILFLTPGMRRKVW